jgi:hypothetical protein
MGGERRRGMSEPCRVFDVVVRVLPDKSLISVTEGDSRFCTQPEVGRVNGGWLLLNVPV